MKINLIRIRRFRRKIMTAKTIKYDRRESRRMTRKEEGKQQQTKRESRKEKIRE
jgi:hypothetical protein